MEKRITEMERRLDSITTATKELQEKIYSLRSLKDPTKALFNYYGSETWHSDREANSVIRGENVVKAGVLS